MRANRAFLDYYGFKDENFIIGRNDEDMGWHSNQEPHKNDEIRILESSESTYRVEGRCFAWGECDCIPVSEFEKTQKSSSAAVCCGGAKEQAARCPLEHIE